MDKGLWLRVLGFVVRCWWLIYLKPAPTHPLNSDRVANLPLSSTSARLFQHKGNSNHVQSWIWELNKTLETLWSCLQSVKCLAEFLQLLVEDLQSCVSTALQTASWFHVWTVFIVLLSFGFESTSLECA